MAAIFFSGSSWINNTNISASVTENEIASSGTSLRTAIEVQSDGTVLTNGTKSNRGIYPLKDSDLLRMVLIDKSGRTVSQNVVVVDLPKTTSVNQVKVTPRLVHNFNTSVSKQVINDNRLIVTARDIGPTATFSLEIEFPKGAINLPLYQRITSFFTLQPLKWWLVFTFILPIATLIFLGFIAARHIHFKLNDRHLGLRPEPPEELPPAVAEVILKGHISQNSIAATIIDLAKRGYLIIGKNQTGFKFGKHKHFSLPSNQPLSNNPQDVPTILQAVAKIKDQTDIKLFERLLLSKLFTNEQFVIDERELEFRIGHRLFSEKIAHVYGEIYKIAVSKNLFLENPHIYHKKFKNTGLALFFLGLLGFTIGLFTAVEPKLTLLFWVAMMLMSVVIIVISPQLPILSEKGLSERSKWRAFLNYLKAKQPLRTKDRQLYERYLPYAVALGVQTEWSARFIEQPFAKPEWFESEGTVLTLKDFGVNLFPLITWVSRKLSISRTPIID